MGRRRKDHGDSRLASDQIPAQNQNNICLRPCHSLWYHHQAFRDDTQDALYSSASSNASEDTITREAARPPNRQRGQKADAERKAEWRVNYQSLTLFVPEPGDQLDRSPATDLQPSRRAARQRRFR
jgi:hypothetical protein